MEYTEIRELINDIKDLQITVKYYSRQLNKVADYTEDEKLALNEVKQSMLTAKVAMEETRRILCRLKTERSAK